MKRARSAARVMDPTLPEELRCDCALLVQRAIRWSEATKREPIFLGLWRRRFWITVIPQDGPGSEWVASVRVWPKRDSRGTRVRFDSILDKAGATPEIAARRLARVLKMLEEALAPVTESELFDAVDRLDGFRRGEKRRAAVTRATSARRSAR